jgi:hypothetical protein
MRIEVVNKEDGKMLAHFELDANPFKLKEIINLKIENHDADFWNVDQIKGKYKIDKIEHFLQIDYQRNQKCYTSFCTTIEVIPLI